MDVGYKKNDTTKYSLLQVAAKDYKRIKPEFIGKNPVTKEELEQAEMALIDNVGMRPASEKTKSRLYKGFR